MHIFGHTWLKIYQFVVKPGSACKNFILIHPFIPASYYQTKYSKICWPHQILTKPKLVSACRETSWLVNIAILTILQYACPFLQYHLPKNYQIIIFSLNNWYPRAKKIKSILFGDYLPQSEIWVFWTLCNETEIRLKFAQIRNLCILQFIHY